MPGSDNVTYNGVHLSQIMARGSSGSDDVTDYWEHLGQMTSQTMGAPGSDKYFTYSVLLFIEEYPKK